MKRSDNMADQYGPAETQPDGTRRFLKAHAGGVHDAWTPVSPAGTYRVTCGGLALGRDGTARLGEIVELSENDATRGTIAGTVEPYVAPQEGA